MIIGVRLKKQQENSLKIKFALKEKSTLKFFKFSSSFHSKAFQLVFQLLNSLSTEFYSHKLLELLFISIL